ncbi:myosin-like protein [Chrysochromulina tobinii]|uniref:Myosin-like protein n=1 Tax=Chrysochromulina tobinii TaxID=1460289 RepID=A0A0M0J4E7_9EUKA|nr:myosin-like protein [Chrysochromulina tobinii]|eukprot:KOO21444.1 myosin-like protein [Chrysochromulina sp. CCMP291]
MGDSEPKKKGGLKLGSKVWVRDVDVQNPDVFVIATLKGIAGKFAQIETETGDKYETDLFFPANPVGHHQSDHTALLHLSDATLLANSKERYALDEIYTFVGPILVAINPFKYIERLYTPDLMGKAKKYPVGHPDRPAHTFSMAEAAYMQLIKQKKPQSLVVSGESGAGKTEVNKQCMNYLVWRACDESSDLATRILESNPVLEALGNAKTVRNNNSSRFGKFVTMRFNDRHRLVGAEVQTFLLEKSRVVATTASGERNYHIFYHVLCGARLLPSSEPEWARLLKRSGCLTIPHVNDQEEYGGLVNALRNIGVSVTENREVQELVAAILALGNLTFGDEDNDAASYISEPDVCTLAASLLGTSASDMEAALLKATLKVSKTESYTIEQDPKKAVLGRDAFCKTIYQRLFDYLVVRINESLGTALAPGLDFIGLLDVFGFEIFEVISFEQLCINFANEKLQNFFLRAVFKAEELAYKNDGIRWEAITYTDNSAIIEVCEGKDKGIFPALDSVCKAPKATDETLATTLHENHARTKILCRPKAGGGGKGAAKGLSDKEAFVLKHFAGDVTYSVLGWLDKNNDKLSEDYEKFLTKSKKVLIRDFIAKKDEDAKGSKAGAGAANKPQVQQTVSKGFLGSLKKLLDALESTDAHFIRCIKPNNELKPNLLYGAFVLTQLKCSGTLEAVELMQRGFPSRIPYASIHERYKSFMPDFVQALPPSEFVEAIALAYGLTKEDYQLGMYKIFMRSGKANFLEELKDANLDEMVPILVKKIQEFQGRKQARVKVQNAVRKWIWRRRIKKLKQFRDRERARLAEIERQKKIHAQSVLKKGIFARKQKIEEEKKENAEKLSSSEIHNILAATCTKQPETKATQPLSSLAYGPRVVSKRAPIDPNDKSAFTINIPQGAKSIIKQAIEEYKQTNDMAQDEIGLLDRFLANLGQAIAPTTMFEYDDIAHSGHMLMKVIDMVPPKLAPGKTPKKPKKAEWQLEYFILLRTKHVVHFQPNTGFVDPFEKRIRGKAIDLMQAQVTLNEEDVAVEIPAALKEGFVDDDLSDGFEIQTSRHKYILRPKESSSEAWVDRITEVMFDEMDETAPPDDATRDYNDFLVGYNGVTGASR